MAVIVESWFIPFGILQVICSAFIIGLATFSLFVIACDKTCHTIPMMLTANSFLVGIVCGSVTFSIALFTLQNDLKQIQYRDSYCVFRCYLAYVSCALQNYSYLLLAIYRYMSVVYPHRLFWRSIRTQLFFVGLKWIFSFGYCFAFIFTGDIIYNVDNQLCELRLQFSFPIIYVAICCYIIPVSMIMLIYMKLVRYVRKMKHRVIPIHTFNHAQRDLKMVRRTVIIVTMLLIICFPSALFILISFFTIPPEYSFRIGFIFIDISFLAATITLFHFTDPLKASVKKFLNRQRNTVMPTLA